MFSEKHGIQKKNNKNDDDNNPVLRVGNNDVTAGIAVEPVTPTHRAGGRGGGRVGGAGWEGPPGLCDFLSSRKTSPEASSQVFFFFFWTCQSVKLTRTEGLF